MVFKLGTALLAATLLSRVAAADDAYVPPDFLSAVPPLPPNVDAAKVWRLSLSEAIEIALRQNLGLVFERQQVKISKLGVTVAKGAFEPTLTGSYGHDRADSPPSTAQDGSVGQNISFVTDDWRLNLSDRLETGTTVALDFSNGRARSSAGTAVQPLNYRSTLSLSVTQPLLRGFSTDLVIPRIDVLRARISSERERAQIAVTAAELVERTEDLYWDVVSALYSYDLARRSQKRAEDQMALTKRQIDAGLMPPSDLIAAQNSLAQRELQVVVAEGDIEAAYDQLRATLDLPHEDWARPILPVEPPQFAAQVSSVDDSLKLALVHRPEVAQLDLDLEGALLALRQAENNRLPQVDVGVSGQLIGQDSAYGHALDGIGNADAHAYSVLLNFSWTPLQRATAAQAEIAKTHHQMAIVQRDQTLLQIWSAVRDAVRNQASAARRVIAASKFRQLSTESLDLEQRKFMSNNSTNFLLAQHQDELANAQLAELSAVLVHKKATAALLKATGKLLEERHVELDVKPTAR